MSMSTGEVALLLGKSRRTVLKYIRLGLLPASRFMRGGHWRIRREDLERFQESAKQWQYNRRQWGATR